MALHAHVDPSVQTRPDLGGSPPDLPQLRYYSSTFAVLALQDYYSGNTTWNNTVTNGLLDYNQAYGFYGKPPNTVNSDSVYWGLAFFYAYRTYRQQSLLEQAVAAYNATYMNGFITPSAAASGAGAGRNVSFSAPTNCTKYGTYAGGVFFYKDVQNDTAINAYTVAPFMTLSAYLFEETGNAVYQEAAQLSLDFALHYFWNGTVFQDTLFPLSCTEIPSWTSLDQWFVEGLSVWANVTKNDTLTSLLEMVVPNVTTFGLWTLNNGIIKEGYNTQDWDSIDKGIFIRALTEARMRNPGTALAKYIEAYITVQFNALQAHARAPDTDFYTTAWSSGPTNSTFIASGNIAALDVLNAAFSFVAPTLSSSSPGSSNSTTSHSNPEKLTSKPDGGVIAGSVVGGVVASAAIVAAFLLWRRRHNHAGNNVQAHQESSDPIRGDARTNTEPFVLQSAPTHSSKWQRFYAPQRETPSSWAAPSDTVPASSSTQEGGFYRDGAMSELAEHAELPTLVHRLYDLLQRRHETGERPPQYEG
ncbi:hypothetical protein PENSPDRAFT_416959 [Peniophora sp. CONT]|nr:hypothetical protein PENSPDRAFT_416959 [Peniophora sp. CONT]